MSTPDPQAALARMRADLRGGAGAGTSRVEVLTHTRGRTEVGGEPVWAARQRLAEDTARARHDPDQLALVVATDRARLTADLTALRRRVHAVADAPAPAVPRRWRFVGAVLVLGAASVRLLRSLRRR